MKLSGPWYLSISGMPAKNSCRAWFLICMDGASRGNSGHHCAVQRREETKITPWVDDLAVLVRRSLVGGEFRIDQRTIHHF